MRTPVVYIALLPRLLTAGCARFPRFLKDQSRREEGSVLYCHMLFKTARGNFSLYQRGFSYDQASVNCKTYTICNHFCHEDRSMALTSGRDLKLYTFCRHYMEHT